MASDPGQPRVTDTKSVAREKRGREPGESTMRCHVKSLEKDLHLIESECEFFRIYDALVKHKSEFVNNRTNLLAAWKRGGELYTLVIKETDELFEDRNLRMELAWFANPEDPNPSFLQLPVLCWRDHGDACIVLWTAPHLRRLGLAKDMLARLGIKRVYNVLPESQHFWNRLKIPEVDDDGKKNDMEVLQAAELKASTMVRRMCSSFLN